ncbi:hypothetical protein ACFY2R_15735 [Micromonospora olivasterospora]|uniref:Uncharacterized protein n=1 Tax=Micromonospora olivasterospora TaxID=1880 RepID=A0A562IHI3_MICOL|nr:hypothetical protein [Micromonospora olivasterospora]TWH70185.1 hypothetical protein JD77_05206 [Micromonospora olivasterospora]
MIGLLTEVGKRVSGRWLTAVLLPGVLLVAVGAVAVALGHARPFDLDQLAATAERVGRDLAASPARLVVVGSVVLVGAGLAGTAARGLGWLAQRWWLREWFLTRGLVTRSGWSRRSRAIAAARRAGVPTVAAYLPQRPTWLGDRVRLVEARVRAQYHVSAALVWPRLWLLLDEDARQPVTDARTRYGEAVALVGWSILYLALGLRWWPALLVGAGMLLTAWRRLRDTLAELAELIESAIDLRLRDLAAALGLPPAGAEVSEAEGRALDDRLGKSAPT